MFYAEPPPQVTLPPLPPQAPPAIVAKVDPVYPAYRMPIGHTHTCSVCGETWDHTKNPGHNCPNDGTLVLIQDQFPRAVQVRAQRTAAPALPPVAYTLPTFTGQTCVGGSCQNDRSRWRR